MSKRYARFLTAVFCLFLGGLMVWQMLLPDRERSDVENRTLQQRPALTLSSVLDGSYMEDVEAYVQDQFPLRDQWTGLKARTEQLIGKRLFNNIYLCEGETLISKVDAPADGLEKANLNYVSQLAEKSDIPMYLGLIPSAAEVWRDKLPEGAESWDQNAYLSQAAGLGLPMACVALRDPYDLTALPENVYGLAAYEYNIESLDTVAQALTGAFVPAGKLPVPLEGGQP